MTKVPTIVTNSLPLDRLPNRRDAEATTHVVDEEFERGLYERLGHMMREHMQRDTALASPMQTGTSGSQPRAANGAPPPGTLSAASSNSIQYPDLDSYAKHNDQADLRQWSDLAANGQGVSLERPLAAMQILTGRPGPDGKKPTQAQIDSAMQFINDNPSMKSALQNAGALKADGSIDKRKLIGLLQQVKHNLSQADENVKAYMRKNPNADAGSLNTVKSAALLQAYNPIAGESAGHVSNGKNNANYGGGKNGGGLTTKQQVSDLANNKGFASAMKNAAQAWSTSGAFDALDRSGDDKATTKADNKFSDDNLTHFIQDDAPNSAAKEGKFLQDASLKNITADTDISKLNQDIFAHPQNYSPQQKAAVMVKLMETLVDVKAGGKDNLRNVDSTVAALTADIQKLASDPATQTYLQQTLPSAMRSLGDNFQQAGGVSGSGLIGAVALNGKGAKNAQSNSSASDIVNRIHDGFKDAKRVADTLNDLAKGDGLLGLGGESTSAATETAGAVSGAIDGAEGATAGVEGAVAGAEGGAAAAEGVMGAVAGGLAAAAPVLAVGAAVTGVVAIVMEIVQAVKKHEHQNEFAANVNPTLQQFGIPLPK
jgi:hypothetical protein